jgi:hypothetical protein
MKNIKEFIFNKNFNFIHLILMFIIIVFIHKFSTKNAINNLVLETKDGILLNIETDADYETLSKTLQNMSLSSINELNEDKRAHYFDSNVFYHEEYTIEPQLSFTDSLTYEPIYKSFSTDDEAFIMLSFIKENNLQENFYKYVEELTANGKSANRATALYFLQEKLK